jgi:hypothetical protein
MHVKLEQDGLQITFIDKLDADGAEVGKPGSARHKNKARHSTAGSEQTQRSQS